MHKLIFTGPKSPVCQTLQNGQPSGLGVSNPGGGHLGQTSIKQIVNTRLHKIQFCKTNLPLM